MPKRTDLKSILVIGAGPIIIGQACEFDYSGVQACKALKKEGFRVILVNSNPATIMTDPSIADATYIEPINWEVIATIIEKERPDALLPTMGGQTALNTALTLSTKGVLAKFGVELIGAKKDAIDKAEDRELFDKTMKSIGLETPRSGIAHNMEDALEVLEKIGFPCIIRPSFTLGGSGGGIAYNIKEFKTICEKGLDLSPTNELLIDESLIGWKEFELEVVRDSADNCIIVCSIENLDPMGVHTGDSITVAPAQTLTDKEYQVLRNQSFKILREIGVDTGGSNVQFAVNPEDGRVVVIEMNPRVSRSSALASKATGFPIAKIAALLSVGFTLDELQNEITGGATPASFEPTIDYIVTKIPKFAFEKFPKAEPKLSTQMKSVGEVMSFGRTFQESFQKGLMSLEEGLYGLESICDFSSNDYTELLKHELSIPGPKRIFYVADALRNGQSIESINELTGIDSWFLAQINDLLQEEVILQGKDITRLSKDELMRLKQKGFSDRRIADLLGTSEAKVRTKRLSLGLKPSFKRVDTCAAEFETETAYMYSTYDGVCESRPSKNKKVIVLGSGPNRIGQGIEFDYCCVHASQALQELEIESIMINCNPETVSTDYDTSNRLYFEPIIDEKVLDIVDIENPLGVIIQFGGQTPLKLAETLIKHDIRILGTSFDAIDRSEDRERFQELVKKLNLKQPNNITITSADKAIDAANTVGYPLVVRPSYVLGGRAMELVNNPQELTKYLREAEKVSQQKPILLDSYLQDAVEVDVDVISDGKTFKIGGILQHIEQAGIHSGDSACSLPPYSLPKDIQKAISEQSIAIADELNIIGLMNIQYAIKERDIYIIEVNPRASRTVPFISKAIGSSLVKAATKAMLGISLEEQSFDPSLPDRYFVKEAVLPFDKFSNVDPILGPEMKSTGEVMGIGKSFGEAYAKAQLGAMKNLYFSGTAFVSVKDSDKKYLNKLIPLLIENNFSVIATKGTAAAIKELGYEVVVINKVMEGRPHIVDKLLNKEVQLVINTTEGRQSIEDSASIRRTALESKIFCTTTVFGGLAIMEALKNNKEAWSLEPIQQITNIN
ncbi:MAG: carbamoyl-phosphate synthase large subunit [Gammaproteobacteria bacterium]